jgi:hemerythrin-like domain-containing protein
MDPIETLMNEHRLIEEVLDVAVAYAERLPSQKDDGRGRLMDLCDFFSGFADSFHHSKEEDILFAAMKDKGFSTEEGPIAVMLQEHDYGRSRIQELRKLLAKPEPWTVEDRLWVLKNIYAFAEFLHSHILKEDNILYPLAKSHLPPGDFESMGAKFREVESGRASDHDRLVKLAVSLGARAAPYVLNHS